MRYLVASACLLVLGTMPSTGCSGSDGGSDVIEFAASAAVASER